MQSHPKEHRIFHYTTSVDYLRDILTDGFWPRFCVEEFDWLLGPSTYIAFPMVCFCDIPIPAATCHRARYGYYAVAMSKIWAINDLNPVWYIHVGSSIRGHLEDLLSQTPPATLNGIPASIKPLLPFLKKTVGSQRDRGPIPHPGELEIVSFEDELEWRHTPPSLANNWKIGSTREIVTDSDHELSRGHRLIIKHADIDTVYVQTDAERDSLLTEFATLDGKVMKWQTPS